MKKIKVNNIHDVLDKSYVKGNELTPYSVLFVSDCGVYVEDEIETWMKNKNESYIIESPQPYIKTDENGSYYETGIYGFPEEIENKKIVFIPQSDYASNDIEYKNGLQKAYVNLIEKKGLVVDNEVRLVIIHVYYPLWNNNSIYGENDYGMFNAVFHVEMDIDVYKTRFEAIMQTAIKNIDNSFDKCVWDFQYKLGTFILNHPKFRFFSLCSADAYKTKNEKPCNYFTPQMFFSFITMIMSIDDVSEVLETSTFSSEVKDMFVEIINDYKLFEEKRTCPRISKILNKSKNTWYTTKETSSSEYTYSIIDFNNYLKNVDGKNVLLIAMNPRQAVNGKHKSIEDEVNDYLLEKANNPNLQHRLGLKDSLEKCRSNVIVDVWNDLKIPVKELVTVDLFSYRTYNASDLMKHIRDKNSSISKIIGNKNCDCIIKNIDKSDIIVLAWGRIDQTIWENDNYLKNYRDTIFDKLANNIKKCYWYGATDNGSPIHASAYINKSLDKICIDDLKRAMGK